MAATLAIESYGAELLRFVSAILHDEAAASDVFGQVCEDIWCGLPEMRWQSTFRTWSYAVARNACHRHLRSPRVRRAVPLSEAREVEQLAATVRTRTLPFLRTEVKDAFTRLRESLSTEEQSLLTLRIDRELDWEDVAQVLSEQPLNAAELKRAAATYRKRFERLTDKLRSLAQESGLLDTE